MFSLRLLGNSSLTSRLLLQIALAAEIEQRSLAESKLVEITDKAVDALTEKGFSPAYGARFLKRHIDQKVKLPITNEWKSSTRFLVDAEDGEIVVKPIDTFSLN